MTLHRPIRTLSLDAGSVLVFPNWDRLSALLAGQGLRVSGDALRAAEPAVKFAIDESLAHTPTDDAQRGGVYFNGVLDRAGVPRGAAREAALDALYAYHAEHNVWEVVPPDVIPALEAFRRVGVKLAIGSNANGVIHRAFERAGLLPYFDVICDSCIEGVEKPDPRFFAILMERCGATPAETLHVGDLYHIDVLGARGAGMQAVLLDPYDLYAAYDVDRVRSLAELRPMLA